MNALWELNTETRHSLVFVNLETGDDIPTLELGNAKRGIKESQVALMQWVSEWKLEGNVNWKLARGYP
jgi:hypothetical protein